MGIFVLIIVVNYWGYQYSHLEGLVWFESGVAW
jgi:hypothetical protein